MGSYLTEWLSFEGFLYNLWGNIAAEMAALHASIWLTYIVNEKYYIKFEPFPEHIPNEFE